MHGPDWFWESVAVVSMIYSVFTCTLSSELICLFKVEAPQGAVPLNLVLRLRWFISFLTLMIINSSVIFCIQFLYDWSGGVERNNFVNFCIFFLNKHFNLACNFHFRNEKRELNDIKFEFTIGQGNNMMCLTCTGECKQNCVN